MRNSCTIMECGYICPDWIQDMPIPTSPKQATPPKSGLLQRHPILRALFMRGDISILTVLSNNDFRNLWLGQLISFLGDALAMNTLTLAIIRMANDADMSYGKILAALMVFSALPSLFLGMIAGTIVDRADRKKMMIWADIIRGFLALGYLLVRDIDHVWIYVCLLYTSDAADE